MRTGKWLMIAAGGLLALAAGNLAASRAMHAGRVHRYLTARLESAFGRTVEVGQFDLRLSPSLRIEAQSVTVGEDPAFGHEYFLRAERVTAGLRWTGLLRGRFELNTFSFTRPSVTLVRNGEGRWNLERWLPPPRPSGLGANPRAASAASLVGPMPAPARICFNGRQRQRGAGGARAVEASPGSAAMAQRSHAASRGQGKCARRNCGNVRTAATGGNPCALGKGFAGRFAATGSR